MSEIRIVDVNNRDVGRLQLEERIFNVPVNKALLHEVVIMQQNNLRQGNASTKTRGLVSGGGKKPWKQKGTGRARSGSSRSPVWVGGGTAFGPLPRSYAYRMPKQKVRVALCSALSSRFAEGCFMVVERLETPNGKTKEAATIFKALGVPQDVLLVVTYEEGESLYRSIGNLPWVLMIPVEQLNVYDVLLCKHLVMTQAAVTSLQETWKGVGGAAS